MDRFITNGLSYIILDASSLYKIRTSIVEIIRTYFTPDANNTWKIIDSENTLVQDGGTEESVDETLSGYQLLQCPWDNKFQIQISSDPTTNNRIYITFHDYSAGSDSSAVQDLMHNTLSTCQPKAPLFFNFIVGKSKKSFAFSCSNTYNSPFMQFLCTTSNKNKMGVFSLPEIYNGANGTPALMYNGYKTSFEGGWDSVPYIYRTFPIIQHHHTILLPCLADFDNGDVFPEVYHLISTSIKEDADIARAVFKINNSVYHGIMKQYGYSSYPDNWWRSGPFLLQIE